MKIVLHPPLYGGIGNFNIAYVKYVPSDIIYLINVTYCLTMKLEQIYVFICVNTFTVSNLCKLFFRIFS